MVNIIGNAIKFQEKGDIYVQFSTHEDYLQADIIDMGQGIENEK